MNNQNIKTRTWLSILAVLITIFGLNFIVSKKTTSLSGVDLTEDKFYTLTEGTKSIIAKLDEPITLELFFSNSVVNKQNREVFEQYKTLYQYVQSTLMNYARVSNGNITFKEYDPKPFSDAEELANDYKIQRFELGNGKQAFYFGIALTSQTGKKEVIPFIPVEESGTVEYKITELIDNATRKEKKRLGLLTTLPVNGDGMSDYMRQMRQAQGQPVVQPWNIITELKEYYEVVDVPATTEKIEGVDQLVVIHPKNLSDATLYAIDQFVMNGGATIIYVDPFCSSDIPVGQQQNPMAAMAHPSSSDINKISSVWGLSLKEGLTMSGDRALMPERPNLIAIQNYTSESKCFNQKQIITQNMSNMTSIYPGVLEKSEITSNTIEPLITTSKTGGSWIAENTFVLRQPSEKLNDSFIPEDKEVWVAAMIRGKFKSAFPDGAPKENENEKAETEKPNETEENDADVPPHLKESASENIVIIVADVDMLSDDVAYQRTWFGETRPSNKNSAFLLNALQYTSGSTDLISVRSRGKFRRPFKKIEAQKKAIDNRIKEQENEFDEKQKRWTAELQELQNQSNSENQRLVDNETILKVNELNKKIEAQNRAKRKLNEQKEKEYEQLGNTFIFTTQFVMPILILVFGLIQYAIVSSKRKTAVQRSSKK